MSIGTVSWLVTLVVFGIIGGLVTRWRSRPVGVWTFVLLVLAAVLGYYIGRETMIVSVSGFEIVFNWAVVAFCLGAFIGLLFRNHTLRRLDEA